MPLTPWSAIQAILDDGHEYANRQRGVAKPYPEAAGVCFGIIAVKLRTNNQGIPVPLAVDQIRAQRTLPSVIVEVDVENEVSRQRVVA